MEHGGLISVTLLELRQSMHLVREPPAVGSELRERFALALRAESQSSASR